MALIFRKILAFLRRDMILQYSYRFAFFLNLGVIIFGVAAYYFLSILFNSAEIPQFKEYGSGYFSFILIGIACFNYMNVALSTFSSSIRQAQVNGTLEAMILTKTNLTVIIIFSSLWSFLYTMSQMVLYILFGWLLFDFDVSKMNVSSSIVMLMVVAMSFSPLGILSASFILAYKRGDPIYYAISGLSALLGGVFYPVSVLPENLQTLSAFLPITVAVEGFRKSIAFGYSESQLWPEIMKLLAMTAVLFPLALFSFRLAMGRAKRMGTLAHY